MDDVQIKEEYQNTITTEKPNINLNSVAGHDEAKELFISTVMSPIKFPQAFSGIFGSRENLLCWRSW